MNRESLAAEMTILEPEKTPFLSTITKNTDATATFHEVTADRLDQARIIGSREGDSGPKGGNKTTKMARFGSYLHRWFRPFGVTDVQQAVSRAGGTVGSTDLYATSKSKAVREMKRDMEATLLASQDTQGGSEDEMRSRGAFLWLAASQTPTVPSDYRPPSAQIVSSNTQILESVLSGVLTSLSDQYGGAEEYQMFAGNTYCEDINLFSVMYGGSGASGAGTGFYSHPVTIQGGGTKTVSLMVSIFETSFGRVVLHNDKFVDVTAAGAGNGDAAIIANMDQWELSMLEDMHSVDDEEDAGGQAGYVKAIGGLFCRMPRGNACIYGTLN